MAGFKDEITRDDGYSYAISKEIFKRDKNFKEYTPEEAAELMRLHDKSNWRMDMSLGSAKGEGPGKLPSMEEMLTPKEPKGLFFEKQDAVDSETGGRYKFLWWMHGYWMTQLNVIEPGRENSKYPIWGLQVLVGDTYKTDAALIRKQIVHNHGEDGYEKWKQAVLADKKGLHSVLDALADWSGQNKKVPISYTSSPSSERLLKCCGIRVMKEWAFIYPHYKGSWGPRGEEE